MPSKRLLGEDQRERLVRAVDLILPETDTPGGRRGGGSDFIEMMLVDYYYEDERDRVIAGIDELESRAMREHGSGFLDAPTETQVEILKELEREGLEAISNAGGNPLGGFIGGPAAPPPAFFQSLRELTAVGYTTSETRCAAGLRVYAPPSSTRRLYAADAVVETVDWREVGMKADPQASFDAIVVGSGITGAGPRKS